MGLCLFATAFWMMEPNRVTKYRFVTTPLVPALTIYESSRSAAMQACVKQCNPPDSGWPCECGLGSGFDINLPLVVSIGAAATLASWYLIACIILWLIRGFKKPAPKVSASPPRPQ